MKRVGPYSSAKSLRSIDGRSAEARVLARVRAELTEHVGGKPSATQKMLIERAAWLQLHLLQLDRKSAKGGLTGHDSNVYLAWAGAFSRLLRELGLEAAPERVEPLDAFLARQRPAEAA